MKLILRMFLAAVLVLTGFVFGWFMEGRVIDKAPPPVIAYDLGPVLEQIHAMSSLTTLRVEVADVQSPTELQGKTGGVHLVLVIHGEVMIGVDLSQARFESVDDGKRNVILRLPEPTLQSQSLSPSQRGDLFDDDGTVDGAPGDGGAEHGGNQSGVRGSSEHPSGAVADPMLIKQARQQTEQIIRSFAQPLRWTIKIQWVG